MYNLVIEEMSAFVSPETGSLPGGRQYSVYLIKHRLIDSPNKDPLTHTHTHTILD